MGHTRLRQVSAIALAVVAVTYTAAVVLGLIEDENKIDAANLALLALSTMAIVALVRPRVFDRINLFEVGGVRVELEAVKAKQEQQREELDDLRLILALLIPENERRHLVKLSSGETGGYSGRPSLRTELRRLRSVGLIEMTGGRWVSHITDDLPLDLGDYVHLTDLGRRTLTWIEAVEAGGEP